MEYKLRATTDQFSWQVILNEKSYKYFYNKFDFPTKSMGRKQLNTLKVFLSYFYFMLIYTFLLPNLGECPLFTLLLQWTHKIKIYDQPKARLCNLSPCQHETESVLPAWPSSSSPCAERLCFPLHSAALCRALQVIVIIKLK